MSTRATNDVKKQVACLTKPPGLVVRSNIKAGIAVVDGLQHVLTTSFNGTAMVVSALTSSK